jgi:hypothetical protein
MKQIEYCILVQTLPMQKHTVHLISLIVLTCIRFPVSNVHIALELEIVVNAGVKRSRYKFSFIFFNLILAETTDNFTEEILP